jgi:alkanesulfonate monooxygenase SsuD/methylene tetrahydromethanopterin reductase-like flavin-dependent oxidoreductase (luciferase family)
VTSFGFVLPQRAALFGVGTTRELLDLGPIAEQSGAFDTVWVGDSLTSKARAESIACLGMLAGTTSVVKLAVGCMASFPVRDPALFAYQWATLDQISQGRMLLAVCNGLQKRDGASEKEGAHFGGVPDKLRVARLEEFIGLVRELWTGKPVTFEGRFVQYENLQIEPTPIQQPCPIWISANPPLGPAADKSLHRVASMSDGLLSSRGKPGYIAGIRAQLDPALVAVGKDPSTFPVAAYHSINVGADREQCLDEAQRFLDLYYGEGMFDRSGVEALVAAGTPEQCIEHLRAVRDEGVTHIGLRMASWDQRGQLDTVVKEILPALQAE